MYCPKCGNELKDGSQFCPKCGVRMADRTQKPAGKKQIPGKNHIEKAPKSIKQNPKAVPELLQKYKVLLTCGIALVLAVFLISRIGSASTPPLDADAVLEAYLSDQIQYQENKDLYQECFTYETENLMDMVADQMDSMLSLMDISLKSGEAGKRADELKDAVTEYFSRSSENQEKLVRAITKYSEFHIEKEKKKGKRVQAAVQIRSLDIPTVNRNMLDDVMSIRGIVKLVAKGISIGKLTEIATGDVAFVLDTFVEKAAITSERNSYTGTVEFVYDKKEGCWKVDHIDKQILKAYLGIR